MVDRNSDIADVILVLVIAGAIAFVGINVMSAAQSTAGSTDSVSEQRFAAEETYVELGDDTLRDEVVYDSLGRGIAMGYDESRIDATSIAGLDEYPFVLSAWGRLDANASIANDYYLAEMGNGSAALQYRRGAWVGYVTNGTHGAVVSTPATDAKNWTQVALRTNSTHVDLFVNGTRENTTAFSAGAGDIKAANSWYGRVDEIRTFNDTLSGNEMLQLHASSVGGLDGNKNTGRLMLDEGSGDDTYVIYAGSQASLVGDVEWSSGLEGHTLTEGSDYEIDRNDGRIKAVDGGRLEDAPVGYISYETAYSQMAGQYESDVSQAFQLSGIAFVVVVLGTIITYLYGLNNDRR